MKKLRDLFDNKMIYAMIPIIPILAILYITDSFYSDINDLKTDYLANIRSLELQKISTINSIINNRIFQAKMQNNKMIIDLNESFSKMYVSENKIKEDIDDKHSNLIIEILTSAIVKDYELTKLYDAIDPDNIVFMSNKYGIIEFTDNSHSRHATFIRFKNWRAVLENKPNKSLSESAISDILNVHNNIIFWESIYATDDKPSVRYSTTRNENLQHILKNNDENEWKYYSILVPSYLNINGSPKDLIVIREINLYKVLEPYIHSINKYDSMVEEYKFDMSRLIFTKVIACVVIAIVLVGSFLLALCSALEKNKEKR